MSLKTITFEIVTPEKLVLREEVLRATIPTQSGEVTILPDHIPLVSILKPGVIEIQKADKKIDLMASSGGFLEVLTNKIVILADYAERADNLNEQEVENARLKAEKTKEEALAGDDVDFADVTAKLEMELFKTKALNRWRHLKNIS
jgi:F-type H+-transporting ATPase subunit epsilon